MLYLDYAATTPLCKEVKETYFHLLDTKFANADSIHGLGLEVEGLMEKSRTMIAKKLNCKNTELIFTSGASEANNLAIKGVCFQYANRGKHIITTAVEHSSVYETFKQLEELFGFNVTYLSVDRNGKLDLEQLKKSLTDQTILVSCMMVNNEVGMIFPIHEIRNILNDYPNCRFHVDMVQALGKIPIDLRDVDLASFSSHKIYGLKGSGLLFKRQNVQLKPLIAGGQQEFGLRAGTSNAATNIVLAKTVRLALENLDEKYQKVKKLNMKLREYFDSLEDCIINSPMDGSPYILNVSLLRYKPEVITHAYEEYEIYISTKSACSTKKNDISRTLKAMNVGDDVGTTALRISLSHAMSYEDLDYFIKATNEILRKVKKQK